MSYQQPPVMSEGNTYATARGTPVNNYGQVSQAARAQQQRDSELASLCQAFSESQINAAAQPQPQGQYFITHTGDLVWAPGPPIAPATNNYGNFPAQMQFVPPGAYPAFGPGYPVLPTFTARGGGAYNDVPNLQARRGSYSTNESAPGTPYYGSINSRHHDAHVAVVDRSPLFSTPSPQGIPSHSQGGKALSYMSSTYSNDMYVDGLLMQAPAIPRAIPAVHTPRENLRTLEQSLSNPISGNRNVYIRGLHPETHDDTLAAYATRFGKVETSKAIIDNSTGACKGFGFAKYENVRDAETCIRGFYKLGYEVGFARESFNSRLKAEGDESSTNLYVSNLPMTMTEAELGAVFVDYTVMSSKILKDNNGNSRGVGFARFESRDVCEEVITKFHGQPIGDEGLLLQVRYADTGAQKELKRITTERRKFRTTEYNVGAYLNAAEMINISPSLSVSPLIPNRMAQLQRQMPVARNFNGPWKREVSGTTVSSFGNDGGFHFKDVDRSVKAPAGNKVHQARRTTSTTSEDGTNDEVTIHASPAVAVGDGDEHEYLSGRFSPGHSV